MEKCAKINDILLISTIAINAINKKKQKRLWVKEWLRRREAMHLGVMGMLHNELRFEDECSFHNYLRMNNSTFEKLLKLLTPRIQKQNTHLRQSISAKDRLSVTLRFLATGETYKSLSTSCRIAPCTISQIVPEVCRAICDELLQQCIKLPSTKEDWLKVADDWLNKWQVPNCIGAMDGKHIIFQAPKKAGSYYYNYKNSHSIVLLAIVDANYNFLYVDVGTNGRVSDGGVFAHCDFNVELSQNNLNLPNDRSLPGSNIDAPFVILADAAFPLQRHILKPYPFRNMSVEERIFNYRLSRGRRVVENVFGIVANRFRILLTKINLAPEKVELVTLTCCVLHNFLNAESNSYISNVCVDTEMSDGTNKSGNWRNENSFAHTVTYRRPRPNNEAINIRNLFKDCFVNGFIVPWQDRMI